MLWFAVALGGALGALARWSIALIFPPSPGFITGTLVCNLAGSYALGRLQRKAAGGRWPAWAVHGIGTGMLGAFTTMSAFGWETWTLLYDRRWAEAIVYVVASGTLGPLAAHLGLSKPGTSRESEVR
ncbi:fluoride efflux transporter FluC [Paenibacillus alkalitolerans]|uniref:fluoride efflux transporter FluC n=1 Tax=Paenibacillus alkalitolerans TaxID=2799335 RepID=UPI0018F662C5|nr:CrcB family protein [Paenibacillus alkalitolerans]